MINLAWSIGPSYTSRAFEAASLKADIVWSLGSGVANDVDYVAAELSADGPRTLHECDAAGVLPSEAAEMESRAGRGIQPDLAEHAGRKPGAARSRRSRHRGDRSFAGAQDPRSLPQADLQDRVCLEVDRGRHLRILRGDRRADRAEAPRSPSDRHAVGRSAGAPRASRAHPPR